MYIHFRLELYTALSAPAHIPISFATVPILSPYAHSKPCIAEVPYDHYHKVTA
ncbi:hypothetical protein BDN72DRAFT_786983 [Pluteus cervinus]|uniref:Uncharacterized protein n=1 Tax=Pluteus cervinus TaxID=181527 RepID=A0ACD3BDA6_9AGAR|nr:hypothetical protein BDN72DRAFT_786983 [Pluteus cervinus]